MPPEGLSCRGCRLVSSVGSTGVERNMSECGLCVRSGERRETGRLFTNGNLSVHQNCLLYSSNLDNQNSQEFDDFGGFHIQDIKNEIKRGRKLKCSLCRKKGATVGCEVRSCRKCYHYPCAIEDNAGTIEHEVTGIYRVFCKIHKNDGENPTPNKTSHSKNAGSHKDDCTAEVEENDDHPEVSHPKKSQSKPSESTNQTASTTRKRANSSDTDESDDLPIFTGTCIQISIKSQQESKQRKLENDDDGTHSKEFCTSISNHFAENMTGSSDAELSPSLLGENTLRDSQVEAQFKEAVVNTENVGPEPLPIPEDTEENNGNCSDTSTNIDQQEVQEETEVIQQEVQMQTTEETPTTSSELHEPTTTGQAKTFWKKCNEAQCVEKIFMKIQKDLNSIQQNIVNENATNKDYDTAWAILLTMDSFQDIMSEFQSELHQNLQHLEEEKLSLQRRESLVEEMRKIAGSPNQKSHRQK